MRYEVVSIVDKWDKKTYYVLLDNLKFSWPKSLRKPIEQCIPLTKYTTREAAQKVADLKNNTRMSIDQHFQMQEKLDRAREKTLKNAIEKRCGQKLSSQDFNKVIQ